MASIKKRPNGRWRARYRDDAGKEHARHFDRKVDAQRWLDDITTSVRTGTYVDPAVAKLTFDTWMTQWMELQVWKPRTRTQADLVRRRVTFGDVTLGQLTDTHVAQWVKHMQVTDKLAPRTINQRLMIVRGVLNAAVGKGIPKNPALEVKMVRLRGRDKKVHPATAEQVRALLEAAEPRMRAYVALGAFAGLRLGEISAVQVGDIDFLRRVIHVERQVQAKPGGKPEIREPKYESNRDVPLHDDVLLILSHHIEEHGVATAGWLFPTGAGTPLPPSTVHYWWKRTCKAARIAGLHLHQLRHFYATGLIAAGCDVATVQKALGHSKPSTTLDTYTGYWPDGEDRARAAMGSVLASVNSAADSRRTGSTA